MKVRVVHNVLELIGQTPVLELNRMRSNGAGTVFVKLEAFNPGGSIKDRPGLYMIEQAEKTGQLPADGIVLEATSGNTGIGLAMAALIKGYPLVIVMPENMSEERKKILRAYGAELVLTPADQGMQGAVSRAEMAARDSRYYLVKQFENPDNAASHENSTAREILGKWIKAWMLCLWDWQWWDPLMGGGSFEKERPGVKIVGVEPGVGYLKRQGTARINFRALGQDSYRRF